jgi:hypothetical protein
MNIVDTTSDFEKILAKDFVKVLSNRHPIDFKKIDLKRPRQSNARILRLFNQFINSPGMHNILFWYKSQDWLLYIYRDAKTSLLNFYGCNKNIDHHGSNIEFIIKPVLHKMLHDNGSRKTLVDNHSLSLVGFGFLPLVEKEEVGNVYQGFNTKYSCNVEVFQTCLTDDQIKLAREILRLIK